MKNQIDWVSGQMAQYWGDGSIHPLSLLPPLTYFQNDQNCSALVPEEGEKSQWGQQVGKSQTEWVLGQMGQDWGEVSNHPLSVLPPLFYCYSYYNCQVVVLVVGVEMQRVQ